MLCLPAALPVMRSVAFQGQPGAFVSTVSILHHVAVILCVPLYTLAPMVNAQTVSARQKAVVYPLSVRGRLLPSNVALEFSLQYASVVAYGHVEVLEDFAEKRRALYRLIAKYFPSMAAGREFRPITDEELKRTSVYVIHIESWSGKRNWDDRAEQSDEWARLGEEWFR